MKEPSGYDSRTTRRCVTCSWFLVCMVDAGATAVLVVLSSPPSPPLAPFFSSVVLRLRVVAPPLLASPLLLFPLRCCCRCWWHLRSSHEGEDRQWNSSGSTVRRPPDRRTTFSSLRVRSTGNRKCTRRPSSTRGESRTCPSNPIIDASVSRHGTYYTASSFISVLIVENGQLFSWITFFTSTRLKRKMLGDKYYLRVVNSKNYSLNVQEILVSVLVTNVLFFFSETIS